MRRPVMGSTPGDEVVEGAAHVGRAGRAGRAAHVGRVRRVGHAAHVGRSRYIARAGRRRCSGLGCVCGVLVGGARDAQPRSVTRGHRQDLGVDRHELSAGSLRALAADTKTLKERR